LGDSGRVVDDGGADSILHFWLEREDDGMKYYRKMKRRQRAHLDSMRMKYDTVWQREDVDRRRGGTEEGKGRRRC
jgi:hypothetical protein